LLITFSRVENQAAATKLARFHKRKWVRPSAQHIAPRVRDVDLYDGRNSCEVCCTTTNYAPLVRVQCEKVGGSYASEQKITYQPGVICI
jgi:hypothetical protein